MNEANTIETINIGWSVAWSCLSESFSWLSHVTTIFFYEKQTLAIIRSFLFRKSVKQSIANIAMLRKVVNVRHVIQHSAASKKLRKTSDNRCRNTQTQMKSGHPPINWIVLHSLNCFQFPWWVTFVKKEPQCWTFQLDNLKGTPPPSMMEKLAALIYGWFFLGGPIASKTVGQLNISWNVLEKCFFERIGYSRE